MSATIEVLVVFDAATILADNPNPSQDAGSPTPADGQYIFMITDQANAGSGQAGNELNVLAQTGDTIRWREATLAPTDYEALLYAFTMEQNPQAGQQPGGPSLISTPVPILISVTEPFPDPGNPSVPQMQRLNDYFWNCTVENPGSVTYQFSFMLVDRNGNVKGYFTWDPFITITS